MDSTVLSSVVNRLRIHSGSRLPYDLGKDEWLDG